MRWSGISTRCWTRRRRISTSARAAQVRPRLPSVASWTEARRHDGRDHHQGGRLRSSRTRCSGSWSRARRNTRSSARTGTSSRREPSGTGPFKLDKLVPRERAELVQQRRLLGPEAPRQGRPHDPDRRSRKRSTRTNALLSGSGRPDRDAAARRRAAAQAGRHEDRPPTSRRTSGTITSACCRARPGPTSACARPPISRSTATRIVAADERPRAARLGQVDPTSPWFGKPTLRASSTTPDGGAEAGRGGRLLARRSRSRPRS